MCISCRSENSHSLTGFLWRKKMSKSGYGHFKTKKHTQKVNLSTKPNGIGGALGLSGLSTKKRTFYLFAASLKAREL